MWPTRGLTLRFQPCVLLCITTLQIVSFFTIPAKELSLQMTKRITGATLLHGLTSLFAHMDATHLFGNMVSQLLLGLFVEGLHGHTRFALLYLFTGVGGALTYRTWWSVHYTPREIYLVGASAAIYGLMGSYTAHLLLNFDELQFKMLWAFAVVAVFVNEVLVYILDGPEENIAYAAHAGGFTFGVCLGVLVLRNVRVLRWERALTIGAAVATVGLCVGVLMP